MEIRRHEVLRKSRGQECLLLLFRRLFSLSGFMRKRQNTWISRNEENALSAHKEHHDSLQHKMRMDFAGGILLRHNARAQPARSFCRRTALASRA
jgi:hypothetical protein